VEVGDPLEEGRPVLRDLLSTAKASMWMDGLLASVVGIEALEECLQVVPVHRKVEALDNLGRRRSRLCVHGSILPLSEARYRVRLADARRHLRIGRGFAGAVALFVLAAGLASVALAGVAGADRTPPTFAGLKSATACIPGPIGGQSASYVLRWHPATDDVTPSRKIVYDIYQATAPGGEDFSAATYTTPRGQTAFTTPPLAAGKDFYFVVRARDRAGNRDSNHAERQGVNLCV
jgi:hypothetical protein